MRASWSTTLLVRPLQTISLRLGRPSRTSAGKARPLLGDDDDLVVRQLLDEALGWDRPAEDRDLAHPRAALSSRRIPGRPRCSRRGWRSSSPWPPHVTTDPFVVPISEHPLTSHSASGGVSSQEEAYAMVSSINPR